MKRSVAVEQFRRARRNASTDEGKQRGEEKIEKLLRENNFRPDIIQMAKQQTTLRPRESKLDHHHRTSILKLPFVDDRHARSVRQAVRSFSKDVRVVFCTGRSLKDMLVSSSFGCRECPKEGYKRRTTRARGRPPECRACDAGISQGQCLSKNVIYSMFSSVCDAEYVGETRRSLRECFQEHYRQARALTAGTPWGEHYVLHHRRRVPEGMPFGKASTVSRETSQVNRRILEAIFIRDRCPIVNNDSGWKLLDTL